METKKMKKVREHKLLSRDPSMPLSEWLTRIQNLIDVFGPDAVMFMDSGRNSNCQMVINEADKEPND